MSKKLTHKQYTYKINNYVQQELCNFANDSTFGLHPDCVIVARRIIKYIHHMDKILLGDRIMELENQCPACGKEGQEYGGSVPSGSGNLVEICNDCINKWIELRRKHEADKREFFKYLS